MLCWTLGGCRALERGENCDCESVAAASPGFMAIDFVEVDVDE
jgi:hypothetical protein